MDDGSSSISAQCRFNLNPSVNATEVTTGFYDHTSPFLQED